VTSQRATATFASGSNINYRDV
jgi:HEAT repeat protein